MDNISYSFQMNLAYIFYMTPQEALCRELRKRGGLFAMVLEESISIDWSPQPQRLRCLSVPGVDTVTAVGLTELLNCGKGFFLLLHK